MKFSLSALCLCFAAIYATVTAPTTPFEITFSTSAQPDLVGVDPDDLGVLIGYCDAHPSQPATILGASQCLKALRSNRPAEPITAAGTKAQRVETYTSRNTNLESVTTVLGVRFPNGLGRTVRREEVARMVSPAAEECRRPDCEGARCPMSVVSADLDGSVEIWIWGEKQNIEWEPLAGLGPSAAVVRKEGHGGLDWDDPEVIPFKEL